MPLTNPQTDPETGHKHNMVDCYINEKSQPHSVAVDGNHTTRNSASWSTMPSIRYTLILLLLLASAAVTYVSAAPHRDIRDAHSDPSEQSSFSALLSSVSDASLHDVLHKCAGGKYKDGSYREDRTAMSAVQKENAPLATSLVELAKRQATTGTNSSTNASVATTVTTTGVTTVTTTSSGSGTATSSSGVGSTSGQGSTATTSIIVTTTAVSTSALVTTITQSGSTFVTTTGLSTVSSPTTIAAAAATEKTTSQAGSGSKTTDGPKSSYTSVFLLTTTLPNGARSTITSTTVVVGAAGLAATATGPTGTPQLQNAGGKNYISIAGLLVQVIAVAFIF